MSKEPFIDEAMVIPACKQVLEGAANEAWSRRKLSPGMATYGAMDSDNPFKDLSDGARTMTPIGHVQFLASILRTTGLTRVSPAIAALTRVGQSYDARLALDDVIGTDRLLLLGLLQQVSLGTPGHAHLVSDALLIEVPGCVVQCFDGSLLGQDEVPHDHPARDPTLPVEGRIVRCGAVHLSQASKVRVIIRYGSLFTLAMRSSLLLDHT